MPFADAFDFISNGRRDRLQYCSIMVRSRKNYGIGAHASVARLASRISNDPRSLLFLPGDERRYRRSGDVALICFIHAEALWFVQSREQRSRENAPCQSRYAWSQRLLAPARHREQSTPPETAGPARKSEDRAFNSKA